MGRKMKDSGIEWIGEIPEGWEITKIKHIVSSVTDTDHFMPDSAEFGIPYLMIGDLKDLSSSIDWDSSKKISIEDYKKLSIKSRPQIGDIIFARYASIGTTCYIDTDRDFLVSYACLTIHPSDLIIGKFLSYYLKSSSFAEDVLRRTNSNTQGNVGKDSLVNATIVLPSIIEQTQIVNFLDAKCSDINAMLSKTRSSIEEYKKLKQAVITQAVTKGVRGEREMKDSGIEWIGKIPKEWKKNKILRIFSTIGSGTTPKSTDNNNFDGNINWLQSGDINGNILKECKNRISFKVLSKYPTLKLYHAPFIIIAMYGASIGNLSISIIDGCVNQACCVFSHTSQNFQYMFYCLKTVQPYLIKKAVGGGQPNVSQEILKSLWVPLPPLDEQKEIADYLDAKCAEIDGLITKKEQLVKELESYKKSLIYEVVTGKREV